MKKYLFSYSDLSNNGNLALLLVRVGAGLLMLLAHGYGKLANFSEYASKFADPIGVGPELTLALAVFAEFFCSLALIFGLFTRLSTLPLISTMLVAVLIIHSADPYSKQELGLMYLLPYLTILIAGPGKYSLDAILSRGK